MISIFGVVSVIIAVVSVAIIVLHNRLMLKRTPVDAYFTALEDLIRDKIEDLYHTSPPESELRDLCSLYVDLDLDSMLKALPEISRACESGLECNISGSDESAKAIQETTEALNLSIQEYNALITGSIPMKLMAQMLTLTTESPIDMETLASPPLSE